MGIGTDHLANMYALMERGIDVGARAAVLEASTLLRALGHERAADELVKYRHHVERRVAGRQTAKEAA